MTIIVVRFTRSMVPRRGGNHLDSHAPTVIYTRIHICIYCGEYRAHDINYNTARERVHGCITPLFPSRRKSRLDIVQFIYTHTHTRARAHMTHACHIYSKRIK